MISWFLTRCDRTRPAQGRRDAAGGNRAPRRWRSAAAALVLLLAVAASAKAAGPAPDLALYMAPNGSDQNDGLVPDRPVQTLAQAQEILKQRKPVPRNVAVLIGAGTYRGQHVVWTWSPPGSAITFKPQNPADRPVFDGVDHSQLWFKFPVREGRPTNVTIEGLTIQNYFEAIWFVGDWARDSGHWNGGNVISNNHFISIGASDKSPSKVAAFAVELVNSRNNQIIGNLFRDIGSADHCGTHALYIADGASGNTFSNNTFDGGCGAPISIRDGSNDNRITNNSFSRQKADRFILDWFCDPRQVKHCGNPNPECPSWNNVVANNRVVQAPGSRMPLVDVYQKYTPSYCPDLSATKQRMPAQANSVR